MTTYNADVRDAVHPPLTLQLRPVFSWTDDEFFRFCQLNRDLRIERNAKGEIIIMPPTGWTTGNRNSEINMQLRSWAKRDGTGIASDSSTGFRLPNGAVRSPDAAWTKRERLNLLTEDDRQSFVPLCPDFVIKLRSATDSLIALQAKMGEYIEQGAQLGWIIDPHTRSVYVYRPDAPVAVLNHQHEITGDPLLVGFTLDLREVW